MLKIKPIQEKTMQKYYAELCGVPYREDCLAYSAFLHDAFIGISQFRLTDTYGIIEDLVTLPTLKDSEALFIMGRQTMNWIDLLGIHTCRLRIAGCPVNVTKALGFTAPPEDGYTSVEMAGMFDGHCRGNCDIVSLLKDS